MATVAELQTLLSAQGDRSALAKALLGTSDLLAQKVSLTIGHADLTDADNGDPQTIDFAEALPVNAMITAVKVTLATAFTGGSASAVVLDVGKTSALNGLLDDRDLFTGAAALSYGPPAATASTLANYSATTLKATITPDGGHDLADLTAGSVTIDVYYRVLS